MRYSLLMFDLDGTLVDSSIDLASSVNAMLEHFEVRPLPLDDIVSAVGDGVTVLLERCLALARVERIELNDAKHIFVKHYATHLADNTKPYDGVAETLEALAPLPMAVVTNKMEGLSRQLLEILGLEKYFSMIVGGDTLAERKPNGMQVRHVCAALGVAPPDALMVGDSVNDIRAAKSAGVDAAAVLYGLQPEARLRNEQALYYLLAFPELLDICRTAGRPAVD